MKGWMYILKCCDGSYYTGSTDNLELRLQQHQNGEGANHTRKRLPVELVYFEEFQRIDEAFYREKQVQGWSRTKKEALISRKFEQLPELSKNYTQNPRKDEGMVSTSSTTGEEPPPELVEGECVEGEVSTGSTTGDVPPPELAEGVVSTSSTTGDVPLPELVEGNIKLKKKWNFRLINTAI